MGDQSLFFISLSSLPSFLLSDERKSFRDTGSAPEEREREPTGPTHFWNPCILVGGRKVCCARKRMGKWDASHFCIAAGWKFVIEPDMVCAPGADGIL